MMPSVVDSVDVSRPINSGKMQLEYLELAGCTLDRYITSDNAKPSFLEITGIAMQRSPTCSGLNANDYKNLAALLNHQNLSQLKVINKVPLPPEVMEHFAHMQCHCLMGVFPEISRVWLTIDSNIYVWAFENGSDVAYFDGLGETIVSVGLVTPKAGVFQSFVKYLLVLTTPVEIVVLGVTFSSSKSDGMVEFEEMHLVPEPVFVLPTDGVSMMSVSSTADGRIFMGGKDGCLYEITYQAQLGWFGKHCKKVNHSTSALSFLVPSFINAALYDEDPIVKIEIDNSRHILYTLSEKGCIELFDLGKDGESTSKVTRLTQGKIVSLAVDIVKTLEANNFKPVVAISAVQSSESEHLNLVAVTQTGARLYFSTGLGEAGVYSPDSRPVQMSLLHVRLPPGFTPNASVMRPKQVHSAVYDNGTLVMVCACGGEAETLWCLSRALVSPSFSEAHTQLPLDAPVWALTALPPPHDPLLSPALRARKDPWSVSRWAVVSGGGACVLSAGAAPHLLRSLLRECRGPDALPVRDFFQVQSCEQACACALYLACEDTSGDPNISEWATRAYFLYGGQTAHHQIPHTTQINSAIASPKFSPRQMSTPMSIRGPGGQMQPVKLNQSYQQGPMNQSYLSSPNQSMGPQSPFQPNYSGPTPFNSSGYNTGTGPYNAGPGSYNAGPGPYNAGPGPYNAGPGPYNAGPGPYNAGPGPYSPGPIPFNLTSFNSSQQQREPNFLQLEYSAKHNGLYVYIGRILAPIWNLNCVNKSQVSPEEHEYMSSIVTGADCAYVAQRLQRVAAFLQRSLVPPQSDEHTSLQALKVFINLAIEMLNLWKVLCEHQFHVVAASLPPEQQSALQAARFRELLVGGQEIAGLLLGSLVSGYLKDNASVDGISQKLRQLCPTLYRQEDATCSKANELLIFAKQQKNPNEKEEMLQHALKLCKDVAPNLNLPLVCSKLISVGFYTGVVDLCVACASKIDPQNKALHYYKSDQPSHDREGQLAYYRRMETYREVCGVLDRLYDTTSTSTSPSPPSPLSSPSSPAPRTHNITPADANYQGRQLVRDCLSRDDELLHVAVYEWLISKRLGSELLSLEGGAPPSLRVYLDGAGGGAVRDLLWKVLEQAGDHLAAATVLESLATTPSTGATLEQRISWVSAGIVCVRGAAGADGELVRRLEEAGEVARVQREVYRAAQLQGVPGPLLQRLNDHLLELTQLYEEYADRYNLWECKLAIVQCSGHNDPLLVENIWSNILSQAENAARPLCTPDERLASVLTKLVTLGKEYVHTGHCFPLYFIVRQLEIMNCKLQADLRLIFKSILSIGVPLDQVLDIYIKLVSMNERVWLASGDESHVCRVCALLLEEVRTELSATPPSARRRCLARCKDLHEAAVSALQSRPNTQALIERISVAQAHLDRMEG